MSATATAPAAAVTPLPIGRLVGVGAVIFFANAALLVLQLVAGRLLAPFIGSSLETWTSVIGVFLAGIALGNGFGGRLADRYPTPRTLAVLLALGAGAALWMLVFPLALGESGLHKVLPLGPRIPILAAVLCLPAGFVLSLLTPLAIKLGLPDVSHTGRVAGLIFALATLGCLIGNYLTGFYLIPTFFTNTLVAVSAGVLVLLSGVALLLPNTRTGEPTPPNEPATAARRAAPNPHAFTDIRYAYLVVFLASFCGMALELTASRVLAQQMGVSLFTWTGIIGVMLAGTALGNFTGGQIADRPQRGIAWLMGAGVFFGAVGLAGAVALMATDDPEEPVVEYALGIPSKHWVKYRTAHPSDGELGDQVRSAIQRDIDRFHSESLPVLLPKLRRTLILGTFLGALVGVVLAYFLFRVLTRAPAGEPPNPRLALATTLCAGGGATVLLFVTMALISRYHLFGTWEPIARVMAWTFSLFFPPMFALGLVSPQVIRLSVPDVAHVGRVAGRVYAWSTVGAIAGTFAAGYLLLSTLGMNRTMLCAALVLLLASLIVAKVWNNNPLLYLFSIVLGGVTGGFILTGRDREAGVIATVESNYYTIKVTRSPSYRHEGALALNLDLLLHSVVDPYDPTFLHYTHEYVQVEFVRVARARVAEPKVLVVGGGGYTFPRYLIDKIPEARVDVVEIDPQVTRVAFDYLGLEKNPRLNPVHMDGRQFVSERAAPGSYDLVVQDAVNDLSVPAHLMTREYNDAVKAALKPNGVFLLTIIDSVASGKLWKAAMATLAKTFPAENVVMLRVPDPMERELWYEDRHVLVIYASDRPFSPDAIRDALTRQLPPPNPKDLQAALAVGSVEVPGSGPAFVAPLGLAGRATLSPIRPTVYTEQVPPELLKRFTDREPGVVLTDQFCPVDNLMAEVFRKR